MRDKVYTVFWTHCSSRGSDYCGETNIQAGSEEEAENIFFRTRTEYNPYHKRAGYIVDLITVN